VSRAVVEGGGGGAAVVEETAGAGGPVVIVVGEDGVIERGGLGAELVRETAGARRREVLDRSSPRLVEVEAGVDRTCGARALATDRGSEERPTRWPASWLAAQASAALTAMPSTAATAVATDRRVIGRVGYARTG
jgi:hypothetical protein